MKKIYRWLNKEPTAAWKLVYILFFGLLMALTSLLVALPPMDLTFSEAIHDFLIDPFIQVLWRSLLLIALIEVCSILMGRRYDRASLVSGVILTLLLTIAEAIWIRGSFGYSLTIFVENLAFAVVFLKCGGVEGRYIKSFSATFWTYALAMVFYFCSGFILYANPA